MKLEEYFQLQKEVIDHHLDLLVPEQDVPYNSLFQAARYSLISPGKRIRPILALATTEILGGDPKKAIGAASTLEMIHTYSLIHDDLPCMDDDDIRRGKPTLHKAYPEGQAVLTGDFLLTHAFEVLSNLPDLTPDQKISLISILAKSAGGDGMIAGQLMDIESENKSIDFEHLKMIHLKKTGALITASIEFGAIIGGATSDHQKILHDFGCDIGLAFQVIDDVLDVSSEENKRGKSVGSDATNAKTTYLTLLGVEQAKATAHSLILSANERLKSLPYDTTLLREIAEFIINRNS